MDKHITIQINGKVQGVWFRDSIRSAASELGLVGYAKNNDDGTVTVDVCGDEKNFEEFTKLCQQGSELSDVKSINYVIDDNLCDYSGFKIL
ncbi:MAG TPA: acylphosphatase [Candidatus Pacebacteria bacterium]|nr:acylphosphatase [Candidatus Paceibacterota bacterium]